MAAGFCAIRYASALATCGGASWRRYGSSPPRPVGSPAASLPATARRAADEIALTTHSSGPRPSVSQRNHAEYERAADHLEVEHRRVVRQHGRGQHDQRARCRR